MSQQRQLQHQKLQQPFQPASQSLVTSQSLFLPQSPSVNHLNEYSQAAISYQQQTSTPVPNSTPTPPSSQNQLPRSQQQQQQHPLSHSPRTRVYSANSTPKPTHHPYNPDGSSIVIDLESQRARTNHQTRANHVLHLNEPHLAYHSHHYYPYSANNYQALAPYTAPVHYTTAPYSAPNTYPAPASYPAPNIYSVHFPYPHHSITPPAAYPHHHQANYSAHIQNRPYYLQNGFAHQTNGYHTATTTTSPSPAISQTKYSQTIRRLFLEYCPPTPQPRPMSVEQSIKPGPKLTWLLIMHRHGDRAPLNMAPKDKYNNITYWPEGFGNLDNAGRRRMFKLGKFIRRRYDGFLTDNIREVYSRSSDVDRCIESAHAVLAGCYPPTNRFEWCSELLWVPAPVHTVPPPEDYLLNEAGRKFLTEFINEIHIVQQSDAVKKLYEESVKERELLERELGYEYDMFYKFKFTYSTLDIEERNGLAMPTWYTPELKQKLYRFAGIAFGLAGGGTEKLKKIRCGYLLDDLVGRMEMASIQAPAVAEHSDNQLPTSTNAPPADVDERKVVHYSTHDSVLAAFLEALNINTPIPVPPGFGATFFIELYVDLNEEGIPVSEKYIRLFYMDDTDSEKPIEKRLPNCVLNEKGQLTLNNFRKYVQHLLPNSSIYCNM